MYKYNRTNVATLELRYVLQIEIVLAWNGQARVITDACAK